MSNLQENINTNEPKIDKRTISQPSEIVAPDLINLPEVSNITSENEDISNENLMPDSPKPSVSTNQSALTDEQLALTGDQLALTDEQSALTDEQSALTGDQSALTDDQSALPGDQSALTDDQSALTGDQSALTGDQSALTNKKPEESNSNQNSKEITLTINKSILVELCQNLNTNLLVNISAYINVLTKLKDNENNENNKTALESNIQNLIQLQKNASELLTSVQTDLDIPSNQIINPETIIQESTGNSSTPFMTKMLGAEASAILGSMAAATLLMGGNKRKLTKRRKHKGKKRTRSNK